MCEKITSNSVLTWWKFWAENAGRLSQRDKKKLIYYVFKKAMSVLVVSVCVYLHISKYIK